VRFFILSLGYSKKEPYFLIAFLYLLTYFTGLFPAGVIADLTLTLAAAPIVSASF
jgi:hypothetical protein